MMLLPFVFYQLGDNKQTNQTPHKNTNQPLKTIYDTSSSHHYSNHKATSSLDDPPAPSPSPQPPVPAPQPQPQYYQANDSDDHDEERPPTDTDPSTMYSASSSSTNASTHAPQQGPQGFSPLVDPANFEIDSSGVRRNGQRRRPGRGPPPPKTTLAALLMLFVGTILLCVGLGIRWHTDPKEKERGLALIILGTLCKF